jgi:hypothetical protein
MSTWFAADATGAVAAFEITTFGARPAVALRLAQLERAELTGWWAPDGSELLRYRHDTEDPGGWYDRAGGAGTLRLDDLPESVRDRVAEVTFATDLSALDRLDLVAALPGQLLLGEDAAGAEAKSPLEMMGLFEQTGKRIRLGRRRARAPQPKD